MFGEALGAVAGGAINAWSAHDAREASEDMFRHRYQTMVADLKKAGLNPMLAYMKDAGTPPVVGGGQIVGDLSQSFGRSKVNSAQADLMQDQAMNTRAQTRVANAQAAKLEEETENVKLERLNMEASRYKDSASGDLSQAQATQIRGVMESAISQAKSEAELKELLLPAARNAANAEDSWIKKEVTPYLREIDTFASSASDLIKSLTPSRFLTIWKEAVVQSRGSRPAPRPYLPRDWNQ